MDLELPEIKITDNNAIWTDVISKTHKDEIYKFIQEYPHKKSIYIDFKKIDKIGFAKKIQGEHLPDYIINHPDKAIEDIKSAINSEYQEYDTDNKNRYDFGSVNIRIYNLPKSIPIRDIRSEHIGKLIRIEGMISKTTSVKPRVLSSKFKCQKCGIVSPRIEQKYKESVIPAYCEECGSTKMEIIDSENILIDTQKMRVSENFETMIGNEQPAFIDIDILSDLCDIYQAGNRVIVTGVLKTFQKTKYNNKTPNFEFYLSTSSICMESTTFSDIIITTEDEEMFLNFSKSKNVLNEFSNSIASSIYGFDLIKRACILFLAGGVRSVKKDGNIKRGNIHLLLVNDPGTAKTEFLKVVVRLSPRGLFTTGANSTAGGLTAIASKDEFSEGNGWSIEGGACVKSNNGVCAVDEIAVLKNEVYPSLYDVMENGEVNISKAGISATLKANTSLICACNPEGGRFDDYTPLIEQIKLPAPFISRFDLIFKMQDKPNAETDRMIAKRMIESDMIDFEDNDNTISEEFIRKYIAYARQNFNPKFSKDAAEALIEYYVKERQTTDVMSITARQNGGLQRLAQAHARIRLSDIVEVSDITVAIDLMESCIKDIATIDGVLDIDNISGILPKATRDLNKAILEYINENKSIIYDIKDVVKRSELINYMESQGLDRSKIEKRLDLMRNECIIMEPKHGIIKKV